jgi:hypothetical protein
MSKHVTVSPEEAADRLAICELIEAYAHCADRRDAKGQTPIVFLQLSVGAYSLLRDSVPEAPFSLTALRILALELECLKNLTAIIRKITRRRKRLSPGHAGSYLSLNSSLNLRLTCEWRMYCAGSSPPPDHR